MLCWLSASRLTCEFRKSFCEFVAVGAAAVYGNATVDVSWKDGQLTEACVRSDRATRYRVSCNGRASDVVLASGTPVVLDSMLRQTSR